MIRKTVLILTTLILSALMISGCGPSQNNSNSDDINSNKSDNLNLTLINQAEEICLERNGTWIDEVNECEGISKQVCEEYQGEFISCGSACRNDPDAQVCTQQCVAYCDFSQLK